MVSRMMAEAWTSGRPKRPARSTAALRLQEGLRLSALLLIGRDALPIGVTALVGRLLASRDQAHVSRRHTSQRGGTADPERGGRFWGAVALAPRGPLLALLGSPVGRGLL